MLSDQQINYFKVFGYLHLPGLFAPEIEDIARAFDEVFDNPEQMRFEKDGSPYVPGHRGVIPAMVEKHPLLQTLKSDKRIVDVADSLIPNGHQFLPGDGSRFRSETTWHSDVLTSPKKQPDQLHLKMAMYLDPLDGSCGALRVIPGSHNHDDLYYKQLREAITHENIPIESTIGVEGSNVPCHPLSSQPGDLLVWDRRILHASYGSYSPRRVISFTFREIVAPGLKAQVVAGLKARLRPGSKEDSSAAADAG